MHYQQILQITYIYIIKLQLKNTIPIISQMQNQYQNYNQNLNKLIFNPYSYKMGQDSTTSSTHSANNVRSTSSIISAQYAKSQGDNYHSKELYDWNARQYLQAILNTGNIHGVADKSGDQQTGVNYFVAQFQKLQNQNKHLHRVLKQKQLSISTLTSIAASPQPQLQQNLSLNQNILTLKSQNQSLRKQIQQQRTRTKVKNQQIDQLMNKIVQIQKNVQILTTMKSKQNQQIDSQIKKQIQNQQQLRKQIYILKNKEIIREREIIQSMARVKGKIQQEMQRKWKVEINNIVQHMQRQKNQQLLKVTQQIDNTKQYYNQLLHKNWQTLTQKISRLQYQLSSAHSFYTDLSKQVQQLSNLSSKPRQSSKAHRSSKPLK